MSWKIRTMPNWNENEYKVHMIEQLNDIKKRCTIEEYISAVVSLNSAAKQYDWYNPMDLEYKKWCSKLFKQAMEEK